MGDPLAFYHLESFVFEDVRGRFHSSGSIGAFDFFSIVVWKANRAKSIVANRLVKRFDNLEEASREITKGLHSAPDERARLQLLMQEHSFLLPMASAILSVLWPSFFTVYDVRVCNELDDFHSIGSKTRFEVIWPEYLRYKQAVVDAVPQYASLRDKDRYLWGSSAMKQLERQVKSGFAKAEPTSGGADG